MFDFRCPSCHLKSKHFVLIAKVQDGIVYLRDPLRNRSDAFMTVLGREVKGGLSREVPIDELSPHLVDAIFID